MFLEHVAHQQAGSTLISEWRDTCVLLRDGSGGAGRERKWVCGAEPHIDAEERCSSGDGSGNWTRYKLVRGGGEEDVAGEEAEEIPAGVVRDVRARVTAAVEGGVARSERQVGGSAWRFENLDPLNVSEGLDEDGGAYACVRRTSGRQAWEIVQRWDGDPGGGTRLDRKERCRSATPRQLPALPPRTSTARTPRAAPTSGSHRCYGSCACGLYDEDATAARAFGLGGGTPGLVRWRGTDDQREDDVVGRSAGAGSWGVYGSGSTTHSIARMTHASSPTPSVFFPAADDEMAADEDEHAQTASPSAWRMVANCATRWRWAGVGGCGETKGAGKKGEGSREGGGDEAEGRMRAERDKEEDGGEAENYSEDRERRRKKGRRWVREGRTKSKATHPPVVLPRDEVAPELLLSTEGSSAGTDASWTI
ncbi:hypothetical protein DFH09DRAFT_1116259 [Mycena vulgaris]|nr:hypothetical protein DFH09DRAFT_1116259 [Mycena vulgaris]